MPVEILTLTDFEPEIETLLAASFRVHRLPDQGEARTAMLEAVGGRVRGIATRGSVVLDDGLMARLPALEIIACYSAGLDGIDTAAAARRGVVITNSSAALAEDVADLALAMILTLVRDLRAGDEHVRSGRWREEQFPLTRSVRGLRLGILGLGHIGSALARRGAALGMRVGYHGPRPKPDHPYPYFPTLLELAAASDVLAVTCPGGPTTRHIVNGTVLETLGPRGWLVNVARGSIVDEVALVDALERGAIAGAGLDVFEKEPTVPPPLLNSGRTLLLPHIGSGTVETRLAMGRSMADALITRFSVGAAPSRHG